MCAFMHGVMRFMGFMPEFSLSGNYMGRQYHNEHLLIRKSRDYVYGIRQYKVLSIKKSYFRIKIV